MFSLPVLELAAGGWAQLVFTGLKGVSAGWLGALFSAGLGQGSLSAAVLLHTSGFTGEIQACPQGNGYFQASTFKTFANEPLAKASHVV